MHELAMSPLSSFVTLTYDDIHLPKNNSLVKKHLQDFMKRLRRDLAKDERTVRYLACGEYGKEKDRPHYHIIFFGLGLSDSDRLFTIKNWKFCDWTNRQILANSFGTATVKSIKYICKYVLKNYSGDLKKQEYDQFGLEPVFKIQSQGLGKTFVDKHHKQIKALGYININGVKYNLPRYYYNRLDIYNPEAKHKSAKRLLADLKILTNNPNLYLDEHDLVQGLESDDYIFMIRGTKKAREQMHANLVAKLGLYSKEEKF